MPIYTFREHLTCFSNVQSIIFLTMELVHQVGRFSVIKGGDGIGLVGIRASE